MDAADLSFCGNYSRPMNKASSRWVHPIATGANGSFQAADILYYASGGYYVGLTLYQMWPVDKGGKTSTLLWRGDFISSATIARSSTGSSGLPRNRP
jgi:hypothetical protein